MNGVASGRAKARSSPVYSHGRVWLMVCACECCGMVGVFVSVPVRHETQTGQKPVGGYAGEKPGKVLVVDV